ncbi:hypothetical protein KR52_00270 [Synechococcus sp. KORDI-52]|nr:hypothetical protein KR52_00270 [Synechococcus sp. KORDI-52]
MKRTTLFWHLVEEKTPKLLLELHSRRGIGVLIWLKRLMKSLFFKRSTGRLLKLADLKTRSLKSLQKLYKFQSGLFPAIPTAARGTFTFLGLCFA